MSTQNRLPWDLDDDVSRELVELLIGASGHVRRPDDYEAIMRNLPEEWYSRISSPGQNIHYINIDEAWRSTVHPARFTDPKSEVSNHLPDGWDRRLDSWGNLFFVDHHTKSAVRENPRFNKKVDQNTGLPMGWRSIKDLKNTEFFFRKQGRMIVGTYDATTLNSKDLRNKMFIDGEPRDGEEPKMSDTGRELLGETGTVQVHTAPPFCPPPAAALTSSAPVVDSLVEAQIANNRVTEAVGSSPAATTRASLPPMTENEKAKYYAMFDAAHKESKWFINKEEAMEQSHAFGLPPNIAKDIWKRSDANHDRRWNIDEYANAIHEIMIETGKHEGKHLTRYQGDFSRTKLLWNSYRNPRFRRERLGADHRRTKEDRAHRCSTCFS